MYHNLVLTSSGFVLGFGSNRYHQLSLPSNIQCQTTPIILPVENIIAVSVGGNHSLFLDHDGNVFSSGDNDFCQLGLTDSDLANRKPQIPTKLSSLHNIISISTGYFHSLFLDSNGNVFSCGNNSECQLGLNHTENKSIPTFIKDLQNIVAISAGFYHSACLDSDGYVWSFGSNDAGQLGLGDNVNRFKPERIDDLPMINKISSGHRGNHTMMLDHEGIVWVCGGNFRGRLGLGDELKRNTPTEIKNLPRIIEISAANYSIMLDENGEVWTCGENFDGELCLNDDFYRTVPTKVKLQFKVREIKAGSAATLIIDEDYNLWGCGSNDSGRLGLGQIQNTLVPRQILGIEGEVHLDKIPERLRIPSALSYI